MNTTTPYYVYVANLDKIPRYVGFGKNRRCEHVNSGVSHVRRLNEIVLRDGKTFDVNILIKDLTKSEAEQQERLLIKQYGREDIGTGTLWNATHGGAGFVNYHSFSTRQAISKTSKRMWASLSKNEKSKRINRFIEQTKPTRWKRGHAFTFRGGRPGTFTFKKGEEIVEITNLTEWCKTNNQCRSTCYSWLGKIVPNGPLKGFLMLRRK